MASLTADEWNVLEEDLTKNCIEQMSCSELYEREYLRPCKCGSKRLELAGRCTEPLTVAVECWHCQRQAQPSTSYKQACLNWGERLNAPTQPAAVVGNT